MAIWRPPQHIGVKVIGLAWRQDQLLAVEVEADSGKVKGVRPPGGSIEFGETREQALAREFLEELGTEIVIAGPWLVFENLFTHEGAVGHEFVFAAPVELAESLLYAKDEIRFAEASGVQNTALWVLPRALQSQGLDLYPAGLAPLLVPPAD